MGRGLDDVDEVEEAADVIFPVAKGRTVVRTWVLRKVVDTLPDPRPTDERIFVVVIVVEAAAAAARVDGVDEEELFWINSEYAVVGILGTQVPVQGPGREGKGETAGQSTWQRERKKVLGKQSLSNLMMTAITAATVDTLLEYVDRAIPPYLLSKPLLQRHHFLGISPDNPEEYLAWPSSDRSHAVRLLLQSLPIPPSHDTPLCVNYTADPENILAHVCITPDLRLIFLWDSDQWLYHNLAFMPFPPKSYSTFNDALVAYTSDDFLQEQSYSVTLDDDSYWNSYGKVSDQPSIAADALSATPSSEDAYWAQYSTVQGLLLLIPSTLFYL